MKRGFTLSAVLLASCLSGTAIALPMTIGTFDISGTVTFGQTSITWTNNVSPFPPNEGIVSSGTGIYSALDGTTATIDDLNVATEPVGSSFPAQPFIGFGAAPELSPLLIYFIPAGVDSSADCAASPPAAGQTCTPALLPPSLSPFSFQNTAPTPPSSTPGSAAQFVLQGVSADGLDAWTGIFTSQFSVPFQTVLEDIGAFGSVTNTYSATFTVNSASTSVPEPSILLLLAVAFMSMAGVGRFARRF
jgi:hypothetical protein